MPNSVAIEGAIRVGSRTNTALCSNGRCGLEQYLTGVVGWLVEVVTLTLTPQRSDVDAQRFRDILQGRRLCQHTHYLFTFQLFETRR
jgi:hypothetical protein